MKKTFKIYALVLGIVLSASSCSKEYLQTTPDNMIETSSVFSTIDGAEAAVNGLCRLMTTKYTYADAGLNGEGSLQLYYGNYPGNNFQKCNYTSSSGLMNASYHMLLDSVYDYYPWSYYYRLILNANMIFENLDNLDEKQYGPEKSFIKAQALVIRAYSYFRLSELYCNRWIDTKPKKGEGWPYEEGNEVKYWEDYGGAQGVPLRLDSSTGDLACCALFQLKNQIYKDLEEAISRFKMCGIDRNPNEYFKPNINVAYGVFARAALTYQDFKKAAEMAHLARQGYKLMDNEEYMNGGFNEANNEWIWGTYDAVDQNVGGNSFFNYMASNGSGNYCRTYPSAISKELYEKIPATDIRRKLFLEPTEEECLKENGFDINTGRSTGMLAERAKKEYKDKLYWDSYDGTLMSNIYIYMQFKFQCTHLPGVGSVCIMRAAEMYYIEAEALCELGGHDTEVQEIMNELNAERDPEYRCSRTANLLKEEVFTYRCIDLWGEGFDWYDYKRTNREINRVDIASGGSFHEVFKINIKPSGRNKWTWVIPRKETDYNKLVVAVGETDEDIVDD